MKKLLFLAIAAALLMCTSTRTLFAQTGSSSAERSAATENGAGMTKSGTKSSRRREADKSAETGTVPSRYRRDVPREYHKYIPWAK